MLYHSIRADYRRAWNFSVRVALEAAPTNLSTSWPPLKKDGRDITNTKLHSDVVVLLYITLAYYQLAVKLLSKF